MKNPLKEWRAETGYSRIEAARALGFNYSFYCQIEKGIYPPTKTLLAALERAGQESERCPVIDLVEFMTKWARYEAAQRREMLARRRDSPAVEAMA